MPRIEYERVIDLTVDISPETQMFPGYPSPAFLQWTTREVQGFITEALFLVTHTGTHIDAPWHYRPEGKRLHEIPVETFVGRCRVLDLGALESKAVITASELEAAAPDLAAGDAVILRTGWGRHRGSDAFLTENPGLSAEAGRWLAPHGARLGGVDSANLDRAGDTEYPAHHAVLGAGIPILENVANVEALGPDPFTLVALPLRLAGGSGSPIRAVALV